MVLALLPLSAAAQVLAPQYPGGLRPEYLDEDRPWEEQKAALPPYPRPGNLIKVYVGGATSFEFFVDAASVSVGEDGVVRYALVARSPSGATNTSYEGIRCSSRERKLYAFGRDDGTWSQARSAQWSPITGIQANLQQATLADDFFCLRDRPVRSAEQAVRALRAGGLPGTSSRDVEMMNRPR